MKRILLLIFLVLVVLVGVLFWAVVQKSKAISTERMAERKLEAVPLNVVTMTLVPGVIRDRINLPGTVEPWIELGLLANIEGTIVEVAVREGDHVQKGQLIARIDPSDYEIALKKAGAVFNLASADFERDRYVYEKGIIPAADFEVRKAAMQTAEADLAEAELHLSRCDIVSPMDGVVAELEAKAGLLVSSGDYIGTIMKTDMLKGVIGIPESDVGAARKLDSVTLTIPALADKTVVGKKHFLAPSTANDARLYTLELAIDNHSGEILPDMFVRAEVVKKQVEGAVCIPLYTIIERDGEQVVFVARDGVAEKRSVRTGVMDGWLVEVTDGLFAGEQLVVEGYRDAESGQPLRVVKQLSGPEELTL